jgi:hypothetical protein
VSNYTIQPLPSFYQYVDPQLKDVLDLMKKDIFLSLNCVAIGTIQAFSSSDCTAQITVNYPKVFVQMDQNGVQKNITQPYPILMQVPCISLSGGAAGLTMPIQPGDSCVVFFNDRDFANWFVSGNTESPPASLDHHGLGNGIAIVGIRSAAAPIANYDTTRAKLYNGNTQVAVSSSKVKIDNTTYNLKTELTNLCSKLNSLCTAINSITVPVGGITTGLGAVVSGTPNNSTTISALSSDISTISSHIAGLLE